MMPWQTFLTQPEGELEKRVVSGKSLLDFEVFFLNEAGLKSFQRKTVQKKKEERISNGQGQKIRGVTSEFLSSGGVALRQCQHKEIEGRPQTPQKNIFLTAMENCIEFSFSQIRDSKKEKKRRTLNSLDEKHPLFSISFRLRIKCFQALRGQRRKIKSTKTFSQTVLACRSVGGLLDFSQVQSRFPAAIFKPGTIFKAFRRMH